MNCQKCKIEIEERDLRCGHLSGAAESHLAACARCRTFDEERLALRRLVGGLDKISAPADFDFRMRARMATESSARRGRSGWFNFSPAALTWPLAACFALVVSASFYFQQTQPDVTATPSIETRTVSPLPVTSVVEAATNNDHFENRQDIPGSEASPSKSSLARPRRDLPERTVAARMTGVASLKNPARVEDSNTPSILGAQLRVAANSSATTGESAPIPVPLGASEQPFKVLLREPGGGSRTISVESVSFGSRDVIRRPAAAATYAKASLSTNQGVW